KAISRGGWIGLWAAMTILTVWISAQQKPAAPRPRVLLVTGENNHKWRETTPQLRSILEDSGRFDVRATEETGALASEALNNYDVILLNYNRKARWPAKEEEQLLNFVKQGKGLVVIHASNNAFPGWDEYDRMVGGTWRETAGHDNYGPFRVTLKQKD